MEFIELNADIRQSVGNGPAKALRRDGRVPAILYGPGKDAVMLSVSTSELGNIIKDSSKGQLFVEIVIGDKAKEKRYAMVKELQTSPVSREILHIDFYEISMDRKIRVNVPVVAVGKSKGVELGGVLNIIRRELEVLCLPGEIPDAFEIDITDMDVGDSVHVDEIPLMGDVEIQADVNFTVLTIVSPKVEEEPEVEEEELGDEIEGEGEEGAEAASDTETSESEEDK
ncbi:MAG: 50S ribosomal protein L25 [Deltaproteobacteria bacterium]|nr:50S ribosomal protein L25 [Deltaproteobacteria bacterium]MBW1845819.1 50S ribosomal protein L25 [Deltaproteobacteria bacterium]MBW1983135.1 50S ribosomal protein L25 [Deltaproteobacteria bacterium]MBW2181098.1 50S ribosomal protein L25 [Deltaproteobacteria bacterium]MBW2365075.1 50S ribosomal protein L25 [Deltaproteobacteria bacterium]